MSLNMKPKSENKEYTIDKTQPCEVAGNAVQEVAEAITAVEERAEEAARKLVMCGRCDGDAMLSMVYAAKEMVARVQSKIIKMTTDERARILKEKAEETRKKQSLFNTDGSRKMTPRGGGLSLLRKKRPTKRKNTKKRRTKRRR